MNYNKIGECVFSSLTHMSVLVSLRVGVVGRKVPERKINFLKAVFLPFWCGMYVVLVGVKICW